MLKRIDNPPARYINVSVLPRIGFRLNQGGVKRGKNNLKLNEADPARDAFGIAGSR